MHRRPLGNGRTLAALAGIVIVIGCFLPWWRVGSADGLTELVCNGLEASGVLVFLVGLAALAGTMLAPVTGVTPTMGAEILTFAFVVVVIGGLGSFWGVVLAALIVGVVRGLAAYAYPPATEASVYLLMVLVLLLRPRGLFGERIQRFE